MNPSAVESVYPCHQPNASTCETVARVCSSNDSATICSSQTSFLSCIGANLLSCSASSCWINGGGGGGGGGGGTTDPYCGDSTCNNAETCASCAGDCGACSCSVQITDGNDVDITNGNLSQGMTDPFQQIRAYITNNNFNGAVQSVEFVTDNGSALQFADAETGWVGVNPKIDSTDPWRARLLPLAPTVGLRVRARANISGAAAVCTGRVYVTVTAPPPPTVTVTANGSVGPISVNEGDSVAVAWSSTNATSCSSPAYSTWWSQAAGGILPVLSGSQTGPMNSGSRTFAVTCNGYSGSTTGQVTVNVNAPPPPSAPTVNLTANGSGGPLTLASGATPTLAWSTTNATSCTASGLWSGARATSGSQVSAALTSSGSFVLTCTGPGGTSSDTVSITVTPPPGAPTVALTANGSSGPLTLASGATPTLAWSTTNATSCTASGLWSGSPATSGTQVSAPITASGNFVLTCTGPGGSSSDTVTINISAAAPTVNLTANGSSGPLTLVSGSTALMSWSTTNATSCTASGLWSGAKGTSGSELSSALTASGSFTLTCTGPGGSSSDTVTINISAAAPTVNLTVNGSGGPVSIPYGSTPTVAWSTSNATSCTASGLWSGAKALSGSQSAAAVTASGNFVLTCTGPGGSSSDTVVANVANVPPVITFTINGGTGTIAVPVGSSVNANWSVVGASSCTASQSPTNGFVTNPFSGAVAVPSGNESNVGPVNLTTTFTLTCTGPGGTSASSVIANTTPRACQATNLTSTLVEGCIDTSGGNSPIQWSWNRDPFVDTYEVDLFSGATLVTNLGPQVPSVDPGTATLTANTVYCTGAVCRIQFSVPVGTYRAAVTGRSAGGVCTTPSATMSSDQAIALCSFQITSPPGGATVYLDTGSSSRTTIGGYDRCQIDPMVAVPLPGPVQPGATSELRINPGGASSPVNANGTINPITVPVGTYTATLIVDNANYQCVCPAGCTYGTEIGASSGLPGSPNDESMAFFVTDQKDNWAQFSGGGDLHVEGFGLLPSEMAFQNPVPYACSDADPTCQPYTILGSGNQVGILSIGSGTIDISSRAGTQTSPINSTGTDYHISSGFGTQIQNYSYLYRTFEFGLNPTPNFPAGASIDKPTGGPGANPAYLAGGDLSLNSDWSVASGESITVFVPGNLTIARAIDVAEGGFVSFVVSGDITIDHTLSSATAADTRVEGVFIADGSVVFASNPGGPDTRLAVAGSFVGWSGVDVLRDFDSFTNNTTPAVTFVFRPDFIYSADPNFAQPTLTYRELAP